MAEFVIINRHQPGECEELGRESEELKASGNMPAGLKGRMFLCTCPADQHMTYALVEAANEQEALAMLPPKLREGSSALAGAQMTM